MDDYTNATDRSKDQAKAAAAAAQALRMALVNLEQKNIQIAFDIDQDKIKSDIAALEDLFKRVGGKDLADQITALQTQATDRFAENVQTRYTALVSALNAEAKRINAMPQDGERDRALEKYVKNTKSSAPLAKELAGIEGKRNEDTRNAANRIRQQIKEMEDGYKAVWRGLDDYVNSLADAQAERALELVMIGRTKEEQDRLTIAARTEREVRALTVQLVRLQEGCARRPDRRAARGQQSGAGSDPAANRPDQERGRSADRARRKPQGAGRRNHALEVDGGHRRRLLRRPVPERSKRVRSAVGSGEIVLRKAGRATACQVGTEYRRERRRRHGRAQVDPRQQQWRRWPDRQPARRVARWRRRWWRIADQLWSVPVPGRQRAGHVFRHWPACRTCWRRRGHRCCGRD